MYDVTSQLFWYKALFMLELLAGIFLFTRKLGKRDHFALRTAVSVVVLIGMAFGFPVVYYNAAWVSFIFLTLFAATVGAMKFCFRESWWNIFFCAFAAYTVRHISYTVFVSVNDAVFGLIDQTAGIDPYNKPLLEMMNKYSFITVSAYGLTYFVGYWIGYFAYARRISPKEDLNLGYTKFILIAGAIVLTDIVLSLVTQYNTHIDAVSLVVERIYNVLSCVLALQLLFSQLKEKEIHTELDTVQRLLDELRKNYEITKENIDLINIKCHDLKHQIRAYRQKGAMDEEELKEIERAVAIYESVVKTGNEALDVVLMDKSLYCEKNKITLTCIADGKRLDFIRPGDIYALFGNAIDNAIEAVIDQPEENRNISFSVKSVGNAVSVHVENRFAGNAERSGELFITRKRDRGHHGFGMLSMKTIVEKYGGQMAVEIVDDTFNLNILFYDK